MINWRSYQTDAMDRAFLEWQNYKNILGVAATGAGKTQILLGIIDRFLKDRPKARILIVAHREELISQPKERVHNFFPHLKPKIGIVMGGQDEPHKQIVIATVQTVGGRSGKRLDEMLTYGKIDLLVIDEAHHAEANQYYQLYLNLKAANPEMKVLGVTATPERGDKKLLTRIFQTECFNIPVRRLIDEGYLVEPIFHGIKTKIDLRDTKVNGSGGKRDYKQDELVSAFETKDVFKLVVDTHLQNCGDQPTVVFTVSVNGAIELTKMMRAAGVKAVALYGARRKRADGTVDADDFQEESAKERRRDAIEGMKSGKYTCLVNVMILTEGFDFPPLQCLHIVRPTKSDALYIQIVGRVLRQFEGKTHADIYDYLPVDDRNFEQRMQMYKPARRKRAVMAAPTRSAGDPKPKSTGETEVVLMDYFNRRDEAWLDDPDGWRCIQLGKGYDAKKNRTVERGLALSPDGNDLWVTWRTCGDRKLGTRGDRWAEAHLLAGGDVDRNLELIDSFVAQYGDKIIMNRSATWRNRPASENLKRWGVSEKVYVEGMQQGTLSDAIGRKIIMSAVERSMKKMRQANKAEDLELVNY